MGRYQLRILFLDCLLLAAVHTYFFKKFKVKNAKLKQSVLMLFYIFNFSLLILNSLQWAYSSVG